MKFFDFVVSNPPYIGYNACCKAKMEFTQKIKNKDDSINLGNVYGVNLNSIPDNRKKYAPHPNLYAFFIALANGLLKDNSTMSYIIPQTLLFAKDLDVIRYHLSKEMTIEKIINFVGKMFVERGTQKKNEVATSSMIIVVKKQKPIKEHKVKIINYKTEGKVEKVLQGEKDEFEVLQSKLLENVDNWYYITKNKDDIEFLNKYNKNNDKIGNFYFRHNTPNKPLSKDFYFDASLSWDKTQQRNERPRREHYYILQMDKNKYYNKKNNNLFIEKSKISLPDGTQGFIVFDEKYKIFWNSMNAKQDNNFHFTEDEQIMIAKAGIITSSNKKEALYLFSLLNSETNKRLLKILKYNPHEKNFSITLTNIKQFIRVPKLDTQEQQERKDKVIELTEEMLNCEKQEQVDFIKRDQLKEEIDKIVEKMYYI